MLILDNELGEAARDTRDKKEVPDSTRLLAELNPERDQFEYQSLAKSTSYSLTGSSSVSRAQKEYQAPFSPTRADLLHAPAEPRSLSPALQFAQVFKADEGVLAENAPDLARRSPTIISLLKRRSFYYEQRRGSGEQVNQKRKEG